MKQIYFLILLAVSSVNGQIINIPDANFKNALVNTPCASFGGAYEDVDVNDDGEIDVSEASQVTLLEVPNHQIESLEGIEHFTGLLQLYCENNLLTSLDISALTNLEYFHCNNNQLTTLDLSMLNLGELHCGNNQLTSLILPQSLYWLNCSNNHLIQLNLTQLSLASLDVSYNLLTHLSIPSGSTFMDGINISGNLYTEIDIPDMTCSQFVCNDTQLVSLKAPQMSNWTDDHYILNNTSLQFLNVRNGLAEHYFPQSKLMYFVHIAGNSALQSICHDDNFNENALEAIINANNPNLTFTTYCTFTPGAPHNTITGTVTYAQEGCTGSSVPMHFIPLQINNAISGTANASGQFTLYSTSPNDLNIAPIVNPYFTVEPPVYTFVSEGFGNNYDADFCVVPNGVHPDLQITLLPIDAARPGFDAHYRMKVSNIGTQVMSGTVTIAFDDALTDFVSAAPGPSSIGEGLISWQVTNIAPFLSAEIDITFNVNSPMEIPAVNIGDQLVFTAMVNAGADETPDDNEAILNQTVVGSFDPNDKAVSRSQISLAEASDYLHYTIRFENTGNFAAENIVVSDHLSLFLNRSTLQITGASHPFTSTLTGRHLEIFFENIQLPPSNGNSEIGHGFISFRIKPVATVGVGTVITNKASIFFDYNWPIVTNEVSTQIVELSLPHHIATPMINIYPNPTNNSFSISTSQIPMSVSILNALGQRVKTFQVDLESFDVSDLNKGIYFVEVLTSEGRIVEKLLKE